LRYRFMGSSAGTDGGSLSASSRERMVATAAALFGSRGIGASSFEEILAASHAPRGSIYYHFPDGKRQLVQEALRWTSEQLLQHQSALRAGTPPQVVDHFVAFFRRSAVATRCRAGCPVAAVVVSNYAQDPTVARLVRATFRSWTSLLARQLREAGLSTAHARALATATLASVEGALILTRVEGSVAPLLAVRGELRSLAETLPRRPKRAASAT